MKEKELEEFEKELKMKLSKRKLTREEKIEIYLHNPFLGAVVVSFVMLCVSIVIACFYLV